MGPLSGVKEQVVGAYAERLTAAGYAILCFDHRNFGASGGEPRRHEDAAGKPHDLRDAVSYLAVQVRYDATPGGGASGGCAPRGSPRFDHPLQPVELVSHHLDVTEKLLLPVSV
jgi:alpha-beta hydrolase superfamily lysophospholipase